MAQQGIQGNASVLDGLDRMRVGDAMHRGVLSCAGDAPVGEVAGIMARHRVHAVAVTDGESGRPFGIISDLDVVAAMASGAEPSARQIAVTEPLAVSAADSLQRAAQLMAEHAVAHLIVHDAAASRSACSRRSTSPRCSRVNASPRARRGDPARSGHTP
jgi:predicted transcriptional regulator